MKRFSSILILVSFLPFVHSALAQETVKPDERGYIVKVGDKVDDFSLTFLDGSSKKLSELDADVIILNFFASWCSVCRKEIPHIEKEIWQPLKGERLAIIGVNFKEKNEVAAKAQQDMGMTYPVALDPEGRIFEIFARGGVTRNIVLDKDLNIIFLTRLFDPKEFGEMKKLVTEKLNSAK